MKKHRSRDISLKRFLYKRSREMISSPTSLEKMFIDVLDDMGVHYTSQEVIPPYIVDFLVGPNLVIEIDGPIHRFTTQKRKDHNREDNLKKMGYKFLRFVKSDFINGILMCERITQFMALSAPISGNESATEIDLTSQIVNPFSKVSGARLAA